MNNQPTSEERVEDAQQNVRDAVAVMDLVKSKYADGAVYQADMLNMRAQRSLLKAVEKLQAANISYSSSLPEEN